MRSAPASPHPNRPSPWHAGPSSIRIPGSRGLRTLEPAPSWPLLASRLLDESRRRPPRQAEQRPPAGHPGPEADRPAASARLPHPRGARGPGEGAPDRGRRHRPRDQRGPLRQRPARAATTSSSATRASARSLEVGDKVTEVKPGDYVSCTVRRPGGSIFDQIGRNDITSEEVYYERGINLCHGYLTETFVDDAEYIVKVPAEPEAPRRPVRAGQRLRQGDRAGVPGPAAAAGLAPQAGLRARGRARSGCSPR